MRWTLEVTAFSGYTRHLRRVRIETSDDEGLKTLEVCYTRHLRRVRIETTDLYSLSILPIRLHPPSPAGED